MDVPLNVEVRCTDGACGRSSAIIVNRLTRRVSSFVVQDGPAEYIVPIDAVAESSATGISLCWSRERLTQADPFVKEMPASEEQLEILGDAMAGSSVLGPYTSPDAAYMVESLSNATVPEEQVGPNELAIHRDARVAARDGDVGQVDELIVDPETSAISHLVLRTGHFWGKRDVAIPLEQVDHVEDDVIYLKLDKKAIEQLPAARAPKSRAARPVRGGPAHYPQVHLFGSVQAAAGAVSCMRTATPGKGPARHLSVGEFSLDCRRRAARP